MNERGNHPGAARLMVRQWPILILAFLPALPVAAQSDAHRYIALHSVVRVADGVVAASEIRPRYFWLDSHRLVVPVSEVVEDRQVADLQDVDIFVLDLVNGNVVRVASYDDVFGVTFIVSSTGLHLFIAPMVGFDVDALAPTRVRREYEYFSMDVSTLELTPTTLDVMRQERAAIQPGSPQPYPDVLLRINANDLYAGSRHIASHTGPAYFWGNWGGYIVALGALDGELPSDPHDVRLYREDGSTAYILPEIRVNQRHIWSFPHAFQLSPAGQFLFLNETVATRSARSTLRLRSIRSVIYIYSLINEDPTEYHDTEVYIMDTEDFGVGYGIGEVFAVARDVVDGSALSTGPMADSE